MNAHLKLFAAAAMTVGAMNIGYAQNTATGSENQLNNAADRASDSTNRAADKTGAALDNAADKTGNAAQNAADKTSNTAQNAADKTGATLDKAASGQGVHGTAEAPDAEGIRDVLASTTEAALKGSFSDIVERFVDQDRNRFGKAMPNDNDLKPLNDLASQFRNDWKTKYNQEFDFPDKEELVFTSSVQIRQGEFGATTPDNARTAGERSGAQSSDKSSGDRAVLGNSDLQTMPDKKGPKGGIDLTDAADQDRANRASNSNISGSSNASTSSDRTKVAGAGSQQPSDAGAANATGGAASADGPGKGTSSNSNVGGSSSDSTLGRAADKTADTVGNAADKTADAVTAGVGRARDAVTGNADSNREKGRNMATVMIPASHGLPAINVPLIHELPDAWRIDVPDTLDAATFRANLQKHLTKAHQMKAQWPADANEAYLAVSHHVLLAIFEGTPNVQQSGSGATAQPAASTTPPTPATPGAAQ